MARSIAIVTARKKKPAEKKAETHKHPVRHAKIMPADNGGFNTEIENHPVATAGGDANPYSPGEVSTGAHKSLAEAMKHVKSALQLKTDAEEGDGLDDSAAPEGTGENS